MTRLEKAFELFDDYNQQDPNIVVSNEEIFPAEYFYAVQLYNWVVKLAPEAGEFLLLASRCQHIGRWKIARNSYPMNKPGYYQWRTALAKFHAETAADLLLEAGYNHEEIMLVERILLKQQLKSDLEVQVMEDALCLVFLQFQFEEFITKHEKAKVIRILQKSWAKMSETGRKAALELQYSLKASELLHEALA